FVADAAGQGKTLVHRDAYVTPQSLTSIVFTPLATVASGEALVGTATDANGNTSEFSAQTVVTANRPPVVVNPIPNQSASYGSMFSYVFPSNTFTDPDLGQTLTYAA